MLKKGMEMSSEPYYRGTIISFDATCTGCFITLKYLKTKISYHLTMFVDCDCLLIFLSVSN